MKQIYFIPQLPVKNRYQEDWFTQWPKYADEHGYGDKFNIVYPDGLFQIPYEGTKDGLFSNIYDSMSWEVNILNGLIDLLKTGTVPDNSVFLFADLDYPGFVIPFAQLCALQRPDITLAGFIHAGSYCNDDLFSYIPGKIQSERAMLEIFDYVFVATKYHKDKLEYMVARKDKENIHVVKLPFYPPEDIPIVPLKDRPYDVIVTSRIDRQGKGKGLEKLIRKNEHIIFVTTDNPGFTAINHRYIPVHDRKDYYKLLSQCRVYLSLANEETFGYGFVEALHFGLLCVTSQDFSYPELVRDFNVSNWFALNQLDMSGLGLTKIVGLARGLKRPIECDLSSLTEVIPNVLKMLQGESK